MTTHTNGHSEDKKQDRAMIDALREVLGFAPLYRPDESSPIPSLFYTTTGDGNKKTRST